MLASQQLRAPPDLSGEPSFSCDLLSGAEIDDWLVDRLEIAPVEQLIECDRLCVGQRTPFHQQTPRGGLCQSRLTSLLHIGKKRGKL